MTGVDVTMRRYTEPSDRVISNPLPLGYVAAECPGMRQVDAYEMTPIGTIALVMNEDLSDSHADHREVGEPGPQPGSRPRSGRRAGRSLAGSRMPSRTSNSASSGRGGVSGLRGPTRGGGLHDTPQFGSERLIVCQAVSNDQDRDPRCGSALRPPPGGQPPHPHPVRRVQRGGSGREIFSLPAAPGRHGIPARPPGDRDRARSRAPHVWLPGLRRRSTAISQNRLKTVFSTTSHAGLPR